MKNYILAKEFYWVKLEATMPPGLSGGFRTQKIRCFFSTAYFLKILHHHSIQMPDSFKRIASKASQYSLIISESLFAPCSRRKIFIASERAKSKGL